MDDYGKILNQLDGITVTLHAEATDDDIRNLKYMSHLSERLIELGYEVRSTDLIDRGYGEGGIDFLQTTEMWDGDILTNPPYKYAKEFIEHAMTDRKSVV